MKNYLPLAFILMVSGSCASLAQEEAVVEGEGVSILNEEGLAALDAKADTDVAACETKVSDLIAAYIKDTGDSQKVIGERIGQLKEAMAATPDAFKDDQAFVQELEKNLAKSDRAEGYGEFATYEEYKTDKMKKEGREGEGLAACQGNNATLLVKYNEHAKEIKERAEKINTLVDKINGMDLDKQATAAGKQAGEDLAKEVFGGADAPAAAPAS